MTEVGFPKLRASFLVIFGHGRVDHVSGDGLTSIRCAMSNSVYLKKCTVSKQSQESVIRMCSDQGA